MNIEQSPSARQDASALARFSASTRRAIEAFKKSGVAEQLERAAEAEIIEERRGILAELAATTKAYTAKVRPLETAAGNAHRAFEDAEKTLAAARRAMHAAALAATSNELAFLAEEKRLKDELRLSADQRIAQLERFIDNIRSEDLPGALQFGFAYAKGSNRPDVVNNTPDCVAARAAIEQARVAAEAMVFEPLGYAEVSERMGDICAKLAPVLEKISLNPPSLTAADAEPGQPVAFKGQSRWVVDEVVAARGEEVAARRAAAASRINASAKVN